jgi:enediyne biosynthesis thioesterase
VQFFETRLTVGFSDTNVVGNVYFANYFLWQGKCREEFLRLHAPQILQDFRAGFGMITKESSCVFHHETFAFEEILIRMKLERLTRTAISMQFDFFRIETGPIRTLVAEGRQTTMWVNPQHNVAMLPEYLRAAVLRFAGDAVVAPEPGAFQRQPAST